MTRKIKAMQGPGVFARALGLILVLVVLAAALPGQASAQTVSCARKHTVESGDTLYQIAAIYSVDWQAIVKANNLLEPYTIYIGQSLCIPGTTTTTTTATTTTTTNKVPTFNAYGIQSILKIEVTNFPKNTIYAVKIYGTRIRHWLEVSYRLGFLRTDKNGNAAGYVHVPRELSGEDYLTVCLKDVITDEVVCTQTP